MRIFAALGPHPPTPLSRLDGRGGTDCRSVGGIAHFPLMPEERGEGLEEFEGFKGFEEFEGVGNLERAN